MQRSQEGLFLQEAVFVVFLVVLGIEPRAPKSQASALTWSHVPCPPEKTLMPEPGLPPENWASPSTEVQG